MKKRIGLLIVAAVCFALLLGCAQTAVLEADPGPAVDIDIGDEGFVTTVNDILNNFADFEGQTVRIEGLFHATGEQTVFRSVVRRNLSC